MSPVVSTQRRHCSRVVVLCMSDARTCVSVGVAMLFPCPSTAVVSVCVAVVVE